MSFWRLYYHLIWATYLRQPLLTEPIARQVYGTILGKAKELGVTIHAIGHIDDHMHIAAAIPPKLAVAECVKHFKGASAHYVNHQPGATGSFGWQDSYGALTFGERSLADIVSYVRDQATHHQHDTLRSMFERTAEEDDHARNPKPA